MRNEWLAKWRWSTNQLDFLEPLAPMPPKHHPGHWADSTPCSCRTPWTQFYLHSTWISFLQCFPRTLFPTEREKLVHFLVWEDNSIFLKRKMDDFFWPKIFLCPELGQRAQNLPTKVQISTDSLSSELWISSSQDWWIPLNIFNAVDSIRSLWTSGPYLVIFGLIFDPLWWFAVEIALET